MALDIAKRMDEYMVKGQDRSDPHFRIRVSKLVQSTAVEYVKNHFEPDTIRGHYSYRGNSFSEGALRPVTPYREFHVAVPLELGENVAAALIDQKLVCLEGHGDALDGDGHEYAVVEFKTHEEATAEKVELARRQGTLYLAMAEWMRAQGIIYLMPAPWASKDCDMFYFNEAKPAGVQVTIATWYDRRHEWFPTPDLDAVLTFYVTKATAVAKAILTKDYGPAVEWDEANPLEFHRPIDMMDDALKPLDALLPRFEEAKALREQYERVEKDLRAEILATMGAVKATSSEAAGYKASIINMPGRRSADLDAIEKAGLSDQFVKVGAPSVQLRLKKVG